MITIIISRVFCLFPLVFISRKIWSGGARHFCRGDVEFITKEVEEIKPEKKAIKLADGEELGYDLLLIATGNHICPEETPGLLDGWRQNIFDYYSLDGATALARKLEEFREGRLVVHLNEMPIKCNVSPLEFAFLADWYFKKGEYAITSKLFISRRSRELLPNRWPPFSG